MRSNNKYTYSAFYNDYSEIESMYKKPPKTWRQRLGLVLDSDVIMGSIMVLLVMDLVLTFIEILVDMVISQSGKKHQIHNSYQYKAFEISTWAISLTIISIFSLEIILRIVAYGPQKWFTKFMNCLDTLVVFSSLILLSVFNQVNPEAAQRLTGFLILLRIWRLFRVIGATAAASHKSHEKEVHALKAENEKLRQELLKSKLMRV